MKFNARTPQSNAVSSLLAATWRDGAGTLYRSAT